MKTYDYPEFCTGVLAQGLRARMYEINFSDGLRGELLFQDGEYTPFVPKPYGGLESFKIQQDALQALHDRLVLIRDHPEEAAALASSALNIHEATQKACRDAELFHAEDRDIAIYREADIRYRILPDEASSLKGLTVKSSHFPDFRKRKYWFRAENGVHAFTPSESIFGFQLQLEEGLEVQPVRVATRCKIDGVEGDCFVVSDYAQSYDADRLDNAGPYDDLGNAVIWSQRPSFFRSEEDALAKRKFWSPRLLRIEMGSHSIEHKEEDPDND